MSVSVTPAYAFLASPPSPTVTRPTPTRRHRASTFSSGIVKWAASVQPGSPSRSPRGPSISSAGSPKSFMHLIDTQSPISPGAPTPSVGDFKPTQDNLLAHGYTSVFIHLPETPVSAFPKRSPLATIQPTTPPPQKTKSKGLKHLRSLTLLRRRNRSRSPTAAVMPVPAVPKSPRSRYPASPNTKRKHRQAQVPPALAQELLMMQFLDGGRIDEAAARLMEANAKAAGTTGVAAVYRDGQGGIWMDKEEKEEYDRLINSPTSPEWIQFGSDVQEGDAPMVLDLAELDHRTSMSTHSACTAELITRSPLQPEDPRIVCFRNRGIEGFSSIPAHVDGAKAKTKARRRPAPLKLSPPALPLPPIPRPTTSAPPSQLRMEINPFEDSFAPVVPKREAPQPAVEATVTIRPLRTKTSMARLHVRGLLKAKH